MEDFLRIEQSRRLAGILHWCRRVNGIDRITIRLRKQFDRIQTQRAPTHDVLAEMQTAARFACAGYEVAFEEPDVVVRIPQVGAFGVAVKRPRSQGQVGKHISKGARQINQTQMPGLVLLDVEPMLHDDGHGGLAFNLCNTLDDLAIGSTKIIRAIRDEAERPLRSALGGWCYGVIFGGLSTAQTSNPIAEVFSWNVISVANAEIARAAEMVAIAEQALMCMPFQPDV